MSQIDCLYELEPTESKLLFSNKTGEQIIEVREYEHFRWLQIDGFSIQSVMHLEKSKQLINPVNMAMCLSLIFPEQCKNLLNIGFGGGAFERCFYSCLPELEIDSLEANEMIIHVARQYFDIPDDHIVYHNQAENFLEEIEQQYDVILCDIFDDEYHPDCLYHEQFYFHAARNLSDEGVLSMNLTPKDEEDMVNLLLALRKHFFEIKFLQIEDHSNVIVFASKQNFEDTIALQNRANTFGKCLELDLSTQLEKLISLPQAQP